MGTVKSYSTKEVKASKLFGTKTLGLSPTAVKVLQNRVRKIASENGHTVEFFSCEGIKVLAYYGNEITVLKDIPRPTEFKNAIVNDKCTSWKFGFLNRITGKINLLFGGCAVADAESALDVFKIASDVVRLRFQPQVNEELIPFSIQNEKTNDQSKG